LRDGGGVGNNMKRIKPNFLVRIYAGRNAGILFLVGLASVCSFYFGFFAFDKLRVWLIIAIIAASIILAVIVAFFKGKQTIIPNTFIDEFSSDESYSVKFCNTDGLREADEMTKPIFDEAFIPSERIEQWRMKNPKGFVQINNNDGILCACFVILGLQHSFFDQFISGKLSEHDIDGNIILPFEDMKKEDRIYISGVVVRDPSSYFGSKRARVMLWVMLEYIKRVFGFRKARTFYAVGLTRESERLLSRLGFSICGNKESRKDKSNLYRIDLDKNVWTSLIAKVGDFSKMVSFDLNM
jgi:hypothetical protein